MAVEIPVVIDIDKAFDEAARRVDTAIEPFKKKIEDSTASLKLKVGVEFDEDTNSYKRIEKTVEQIMNLKKGKNGHTYLGANMQELVTALEDAKSRYSQIVALEQKGASIDKQKASDLRDAIVILTAEVEQREHAVNLVTRETEKIIQATRAEEERRYILQQDAVTISQINERLAALRGRLDNLDPKSKEWTETAKEIQKATIEAEKYQQKLSEITKLPTKPGSINRINADLQKLIDKWNAMSAAQKFDKDGNLKASAQKVIDKYAELTEKAEKYGKSLQDYTKKAKDGTDQLSSSLSSQNGVLGKLIATFGTYVSIHSLFRFAKQIRDVTGELEYQRIALGHIIQDEEYGAKMFEEIKKAAVESPFRIKELVTYTKQLAAYRVETTQLLSTTKMLADVSAGLGVDMNRLILAYGQVRAASVLRGQELRQFTEAGIPLVELLAEKFTELTGKMTSTADVFELISKRMVPFSMISEIFQDMTDVGGQFFEMQQTQAKTLQGRWEKLKDTFDIALQSIGDSKGVLNFRNEMNLVLAVLNLVAKNIRVIPKLLEGAVAGWIVLRIATVGYRRELDKAAISQNRMSGAEMRNIITKQGNTLATKIYTKALIKQRIATNALSKSFWKLTAAMAANPIGAILAGVAALTVAFLSFRKKTDEATEGLEELSDWTDTIERQGEVISKHKRMDQLIIRYERLASKTKLTAKEQQALSQAMRVLQGQFKDVTLELNNANNSVASQASRLRQLNDAQKDAAISTLQLTKANIELRLSELGTKEQDETASWLEASRNLDKVKDKYKGVEKLSRKQRRELKKAEEEYNKYGDALNQTSQNINTLENRLVSIENILNPQSGDTAEDAATDRLAKLREAINDVTNAYKKFQELLEYEGREKALKDIGILFPSLGGWEPSFDNMVNTLNEMLDRYKGDADATRLIEQAIANVKFDKLKSTFDEKLKKLEDDIKKSETARKFYENIFDMTGDQDIAENLTVSVYGSIGKDFKDRLQEELYRALTDLEPENIDKDLMSQIMGDIAVMDIDDIMENLDKLPKKVRETFSKALAENQKYNADYLSGLYKTYSKAMDYEKRIQAVRDREEAERRRIMANEAIPEGEKQALIDASKKKELQDIAAIQVENLKNQDEWKKAFEDLDRVGNKTLTDLKNKILAIIDAESANMLPEDLKALREELEKIDETMARRDPFTAIKNGMQRSMLIRGATSQKEGTAEYDEAIEKIRKFNEEAKDTEKIDIENLEDGFRAANKEIEDGINGVKEYLEAWQGVVDTLVDAFDLDEVPVLGDTLKGVSDALSFVAGILPVIITLNKILNGTLMLNPIIAAGAGIVATIGGIVGLIRGIVNAKVERLNKKIEKQGKLIEALDRSYQRLEKAMAKSFGSDYIYNYNQQLDNLAAKQAAYEEQARLEQEKGKKADQEKVEEYKQSAEDAAEEIADMNGKLAEFFTGTDVTSAAKDFANSWIEAYKEFGSTTSAMKEKFQDLIQSMVEQSIGAKIMQSILQPLFDSIDEMAKEGGELSAQEIAQIAQSTPEYIDKINNAMTNMMNQLTAAGYNMRQGVGQFTGISRDIAGASEESITGLAAGINTQNFYMSLISQNVAAILATLTGGAEVTGVAGAAAPEDPYKKSMLEFVGFLPQMHDDMYAVRQMLEKVIKPNGTASTHYVATRS